MRVGKIKQGAGSLDEAQTIDISELSLMKDSILGPLIPV